MMKKVLAAALLLGCGNVLACDISPPVDVEATISEVQSLSMDTAWDAIANDMRALGTLHYGHEGRVNVHTTIVVRVLGVPIESFTNNYPMEKQCNQTLEEAANHAAANARQILNPPDTGSNNGGGGPMYTPIITRGFTQWVFRCTVGGRQVLCSEYTDGN